MKIDYVIEFLETERKIRPLGEITLEEECVDSETPIGYRILIDKKDVDIIIWWADYALFLERKLLLSEAKFKVGDKVLTNDDLIGTVEDVSVINRKLMYGVSVGGGIDYGNYREKHLKLTE